MDVAEKADWRLPWTRLPRPHLSLELSCNEHIETRLRQITFQCASRVEHKKWTTGSWWLYPTITSASFRRRFEFCVASKLSWIHGRDVSWQPMKCKPENGSWNLLRKRLLNASTISSWYVVNFVAEFSHGDSVNFIKGFFHQLRKAMLAVGKSVISFVDSTFVLKRACRHVWVHWNACLCALSKYNLAVRSEATIRNGNAHRVKQVSFLHMFPSICFFNTLEKHS